MQKPSFQVHGIHLVSKKKKKKKVLIVFINVKIFVKFD